MEPGGEDPFYDKKLKFADPPGQSGVRRAGRVEEDPFYEKIRRPARPEWRTESRTPPFSPQDSSTSFGFFALLWRLLVGRVVLGSSPHRNIGGFWPTGRNLPRPAVWARPQFPRATMSETHTGAPKALLNSPKFLIWAVFPPRFQHTRLQKVLENMSPRPAPTLPH